MITMFYVSNYLTYSSHLSMKGEPKPHTTKNRGRFSAASRKVGAIVMLKVSKHSHSLHVKSTSSLFDKLASYNA